MGEEEGVDVGEEEEEEEEEGGVGRLVGGQCQCRLGQEDRGVVDQAVADRAVGAPVTGVLVMEVRDMESLIMGGLIMGGLIMGGLIMEDPVRATMRQAMVKWMILRKRCGRDGVEKDPLMTMCMFLHAMLVAVLDLK